MAWAAALVVVAGCGSGSDSGQEGRLWIAPEVVDCVGVGHRWRLLVKESGYAEWEFFYDRIEGFIHVEGTSYVVDVEITEVDDPPADAGSVRYRLIRVVESVPGPG